MYSEKFRRNVVVHARQSYLAGHEDVGHLVLADLVCKPKASSESIAER